MSSFKSIALLLVVLSAVMIVDIKAAVTCGASSLGRRGMITSPDYPADYESDTTCNWSLASSSNIRISFVVQDMDTEEGFDIVSIYDGPNDKSPLLASLSGKVAPGTTVDSTVSGVYVKFTSDSDINGRGFNITWSEY